MSVTFNTNTLKYREETTDPWAPLMLHAEAEVDAVVQDTEPTGSENVWFDTSDTSEVQIPTMTDLQNSTRFVDTSSGKTWKFNYGVRPRIVFVGGSGLSYEYIEFPFELDNTNYTVSVVNIGIANISASVTVTVYEKGTYYLILSYGTENTDHGHHIGRPAEGTITFA